MISNTHDLVWDDQWKCNVWWQKPEYLKQRQEALMEMNTIEYQSGSTIYEKYKRSMELTRDDMTRLHDASFIISMLRKQSGKTPNKDFLTQSVGEFLNGKHKEQEKIEKLITEIFKR